MADLEQLRQAARDAEDRVFRAAEALKAAEQELGAARAASNAADRALIKAEILDQPCPAPSTD